MATEQSRRTLPKFSVIVQNPSQAQVGSRTEFKIARRSVDMKHLKEGLIGGFGIDPLCIKACSFSPSLSLEIGVPLFLEIQGYLCKRA